MSNVVICPSCEAKLRTSGPRAPDKRLRCPKCNGVFRPYSEYDHVSDDDWDEEPYPPEPATPKPRRRASTTSARRAKHAPKKAARKRSGRSTKKNPPVLRWGLLAGGILCLVLIALVGVAFMNHSGEPTDVAATNEGRAKTETSQQPAFAGPPITSEECQRFVKDLEQSVNNSDGQTFQRLLNIEAILDKALADIELPEEAKSQIRKGAVSTGGQICGRLFSQLKPGSYTWLHTTEPPNGTPQVLFRASIDNGLNYHRFDLVRNQQQNVVCGDMFIFVSGEYLSETLRRMLIPIAASASRSLIERLTGTDNAFVKNLPQIQKMQQALANGNPQKALSICKSLPEELQSQKWLLLTRLQASQQVSDDEYVAAMETFRESHTGDVCLDLMLIDYHLLKKEFRNGLKSIDRLNSAVGGDPKLSILKSTFLISAGQPEEARKTLTPLLNDEHLAEEAYASMLDVDLALKDHPATADTLRVLQKQFGYQFQNLNSVAEFSHFVKSPEYQEWQAEMNAGTSTPSASQQNQPLASAEPPAPEAISFSSIVSPPSAKANQPAGDRHATLSIGRDCQAAFIRFKVAIGQQDVEKAASFVAPIQDREQIMAALQSTIENTERKHMLMFTNLGESHTIGNITLFRSKTVQTIQRHYDRLYFVKVGGEWKVAPTGPLPPTQPEYQDAVEALEAWFSKQVPEGNAARRERRKRRTP